MLLHFDRGQKVMVRRQRRLLYELFVIVQTVLRDIILLLLGLHIVNRNGLVVRSGRYLLRFSGWFVVLVTSVAPVSNCI